MASPPTSTLAYLGSLQARSLRLPMLATRVCAGFPSPADDYLDDDIDLARLLAPNPAATFLWRVAGDSQKEAGIHDGDIVVVDRSATPQHGQVVLAVIHGQPSLKTYQTRPTRRLAFANASFPPFELDEGADAEIWGVVLWSLHKPRLP